MSSSFPATAKPSDKPQAEITSLKSKRAAVLLYGLYLIDPRARRAAEAMREEGMAVDVLCLSESEEEPAQETVNGVRIFRLPMKQQRHSKWTYLWQYGRFFASSFWFLTWVRQKYDVVHVHNMPDVLVFSAVIAKARGARLILDLHDPMPELMMNIYELSATSWQVRLLRWVERGSISFADVVLTPNITFKKLFASRSCRPEKIHIVMNSPLPDVFKPDTAPVTHPRPEGIFRIMHHGSILHRHGVDLLVEAVAQLRTKMPGLRLDIYGVHTPFTDTVLALVKQLDLGEVVNYHGSKSQFEITQAIQQSDLGIVPNRRSAFTELNFPTRIFEYLAMHRPVIVPSTQGIRDYFSSDQILMFEPGNVEDLAAKIRWVSENPDAVSGIVDRGMEIYRNNLWTTERQRLLECTAGPAAVASTGI